jgi:hypothetical protein
MRSSSAHPMPWLIRNTPSAYASRAIFALRSACSSLVT